MGSKMPLPSCVHSNNFIGIITELWLWPFLLTNANAINHDVEIVIILIGIN